MAEWRGRRSARIGPWLAIGAAAWLIAGSAGLGRAQGPPSAIAPGPGIGGAAPLPLPGPDGEGPSVGLPPRGGRPIPGSRFDPGASGPGIGSTNRELFLGGALDTRSGWPFV